MKGYRTLALNVLGVILPVLQAVDITAFSPTAMAGYGIILCSANILMRLLTTTPVGGGVTIGMRP